MRSLPRSPKSLSFLLILSRICAPPSGCIPSRPRLLSFSLLFSADAWPAVHTPYTFSLYLIANWRTCQLPLKVQTFKLPQYFQSYRNSATCSSPNGPLKYAHTNLKNKQTHVRASLKNPRPAPIHSSTHRQGVVCASRKSPAGPFFCEIFVAPRLCRFAYQDYGIFRNNKSA